MPLASLWVHCLEDPHESLHDPRPGTLDHSWAEVGQLVGSQQPCNTQRPGIIEVGAVPAESQKRVSLLCQPEDGEVSHGLPCISLQRWRILPHSGLHYRDMYVHVQLCNLRTILTYVHLKNKPKH